MPANQRSDWCPHSPHHFVVFHCSVKQQNSVWVFVVDGIFLWISALRFDLYVVVFPAWISNCQSILSQGCFFFSFPFFLYLSCLNCMLPVELLCKVMGKITVYLASHILPVSRLLLPWLSMSLICFIISYLQFSASHNIHIFFTILSELGMHPNI